MTAPVQRRRGRGRGQAGFTLLEVMIAMGLLVTILFIVWGSTDQVSRLSRKSEGVEELYRGVRLSTEQHAEKPNPTFIAEGNAAAAWLAERTGGIAQSMVPEALANIPTTAHILGGAVIGADAGSGVVDATGRVFGYLNLLICDGAIMPANPGVNPSLTITALAEHVMSGVPAVNA